MAIDQAYIEELSRRTDITELVGAYVELKRAGRMERGLCPFHNEKTPSFYVYPETNSFYCFGCGAGGDPITFVKRIQNLDYVEAVKFLAARAGMPMPDEDDELGKIRGRVLAINREAARFYVERLNSEEGAGARAYLRRRQLADKTIRQFGLGFAPDKFSTLRDHLARRGYSDEDLLQAGVCKKSAKGNVYDAFRGRVMFPIIDLRGNVIAFGGRAMEDSGPKYLNSSDTPVFKKSRGLFALNLAKKSHGRRYLLAEGYMDVISLHQAGFDTAIATLGTALTAEQAKLLSGYADEIVICYDSDEAGQKATARAISLLDNTTLKTTVLKMEGAKDPDEFIKAFGAERFRQLLSGSANTIEYALEKAGTGLDLTTPDGRVAYLAKAVAVLAETAGPVERDIYAGRLAEQTDVSRQAILAQLEAALRQRQRRLKKEREQRIKGEGIAAGIQLPYSQNRGRALAVAHAEQQLVAALLLNTKDYLPLTQGRLAPEGFLSPDMGEAYRLIAAKARGTDYVDLTMLSGELEENTLTLLSRVLAQNHGTSFSTADVEMFIGRIEEGNRDPAKAAQMTPEELGEYFEAMKKKKQGDKSTHGGQKNDDHQ